MRSRKIYKPLTHRYIEKKDIRNLIKQWYRMSWLVMSVFFLACDNDDSPKASIPSTFVKMYGGPGNQRGVDVKPTSDGGYIILGSSNSFGNNQMDLFLIKVNNQGNEEWSRTYGKAKDDWGNAIVVTKGGEYILLGTSTNEVDSTDLFLVKVDVKGDKIWERTIGERGSNETGRMIKEDLDGNGFVLVGNTSRLDFGKYTSSSSVPDTDVTDAYLVRVDQYGQVLMTRTLGFNGPDIANDVIPVRITGQQDEYVFIGTSTEFENGIVKNGSDVRFFKTNKTLGSNIERNYGGDKNETGNAVCPTNDGGYAIIGSSASYGNGNDDVYLVKFRLTRDNEINNIQFFNYGGIGQDQGVSIKQNEDGSFIVLGTTTSYGNGGTDIYLLKVSALGELSWSRTFGEEGNDAAGKVIVTSDGGYAFVGTLRFGNNDMIYFVKTNSEGMLSVP